MFKFLFPAALFFFSSVSAAKEISGVVLDINNTPIKNAKIEVHGTNGVYFSDQNGKFNIDVADNLKEIDLHISARGYSHHSLHNEISDVEITVVLADSAIEYIDVYATPLHASTLESATPITVISDEDLKNHHSSTLGETLKTQVGVHSTYYGPVSSSPIIRGLDGPRVMISQNSLDVGDVSRVGPDHVVSTETSTVKQIEILRGPATLIFGNGAIGGVVNIVDNRVPTDTDFEADWQLSHNTVADENELAINFSDGFDNFAYHFDAFWRDSGNFEIPAEAEIHEDESEEEHEEHDTEFSGIMENSASTADGFNVGASYLLDQGFVGISFGKINRLYGIPGHSHAEDESEEEHNDALVKGDMQQERIQVLSELDINQFGLEAINTKMGITNYQHAEIEGGVVGTQFKNDSIEIRTDLLLQKFDDWHGAITFDYKHSDFEAVGDEAFTAPSETEIVASALLAEKHFGDVLIQLGARVENIEISTKPFEVDGSIFESEEEHESHDEGEHAEEHHINLDFSSFNYTPVSLSAGLVWDFTKGQNIGLSYTRSERAPTASEIFAYGPHIGTNTYEIGAIFGLHQEDNELHLEVEEHELELETANNIELSYRKFDNNIGLVVNVFYNQINDFYFQKNTGLFAELAHDEHEEIDEIGDHDDHDEAALPIYITQAQDAEFYGVEGQFVWQYTPSLEFKLQGDTIKGKLKNGDDLPRIPPARIGFMTNYETQNTSTDLEIMHHFKQSDISEFETATEAYTLINIIGSYHFMMNQQDLTAYIKVNNLSDTEARVHSSYLKNQTLLPGRGITLGLRGQF